MAKTVAEIDGDSSGLVGALDKGRDGMVKMEASGKKLSDQLKEVADKADQAAGAIVERVGGPKAIAALGGAGIALGGAKMAADFFLNSVEKLFKSMGDEGMKVWADVEESLSKISGAFAKVVLGGGSAEDMGKKLITVFDGLAKIVEVLVTYGFPGLKLGFDALAFAMEGLNKLTGEGVEKFDALKRSQDAYASATAVTNVENLTKAYTDLSTSLQGVIGDETALAMSANDRAQAEMQALKASFIKVGDIIRDTEIRKEVEKHRDGIERQAAAEVANLDLTAYGMGWKMVAEREMADRVATKTGEMYSSIAKKFAESGKNAYSFMPQALQEAYDSAEADLSLLWEKANMLYDRYLGKEPKPPSSTGGGAPKAASAAPVIGEAEAAEKAARDARMAEYFKEDEEMKKTIAASYENFGMGITRVLFGTGDLADSFTILGGEIKAVWNGIVDDTVTGIEEVGNATAKVETARSAFYDKWIANQAKMIGTAIGNGEKMADIGRKAIGMVVSGLGDEMLARASIATFSGNFAGAAGLTAGAVAAYAAASALGASGKKAATATAATGPAPSPVTNNTSYNLQVDAAFADEEGIARAFSKAQAIAKSRHMFREAMAAY
jgi:hypothetical protein